MRLLRFIWQGVLAFDRIGSRIPQLVQMWLIELFLVMPVTLVVSSIVDAHGAFGVPGTGEHLDGGDWAALGVGLVAGFFIKSLVRRRVKTDTGTPRCTPTSATPRCTAATGRGRCGTPT